jgi:DNA processing protein
VRKISNLFIHSPVNNEKRFFVNDLYYWIALRNVCGIGKVNYNTLIDQFGTPEKIFAAHSKELEKVAGITPSAIKSIQNFQGSAQVDRELNLIESKGVQVITLKDVRYPENLKKIYDPPPFFYLKGALLDQDQTSFAIVGSRNPSEYGTITTKRMSRELSLSGLTIVSGMARGIDSSAHYGALTAKGRTIAVLGSGIDVIYPPENIKLYQSIAACGAVISEFPMGTEPLAYNFPARNRIISGLALGVLIVEASLRSGSLITARFALEQGRDVFAIPGNINSYKSKGTHKLLKEGAKLVDSTQDILEELNLYIASLRKTTGQQTLLPTMNATSQLVYQVLQDQPLHIDEIILKAGLASNQVSAILLDLELDGLIKQLPGKRFMKAELNVR